MLRIFTLVFSLLFTLNTLSLVAQTSNDDQPMKEKKTSKKEQVEESASEEVLKIKGSAKAWQKKGDKLRTKGANYAAIENYQIAVSKAKKKKLKKKLFYKIGESAYSNRDYVLAETNYTKSFNVATKKNKFPLTNFQRANSLKHQADYSQASSLYESFISEIGDKEIFAGFKNKARLEQKGCVYAMALEVDEPKYTVENAGEKVNGIFADFGPEIRGEELIFSKIKKEDEEDNPLAKIYTAEFVDDQFNTAQLFSSNLNAGEEFVGNPSFTADGKTIYFTKCNLDDNRQTNCMIYKAFLEDGVWSKPEALGLHINALGSSNTHPQITTDEEGNEVLYFSSNRIGGRGSKDIWMSSKNENGTFARAQNLGATINTKYDEVSPFYDEKTKVLFFSTDGKVSLGGFDVYQATKTGDGWSEASALLPPINSSLDDYDFIVGADNEYGFLVSNRIGTLSNTSSTCCDDIFLWRTTEIELYLKGLVYAENKTSRELVDKADVRLLSVGVKDAVNIPYTGEEYLVQLDKEMDYKILAESDNFKTTELSFSTKGLVRSDTLQYDLFFTERKSFNNRVIGTIYYEYNQARLTKEAPKTLKEIVLFLETYPNTIVEISAHTDGKGPAAYNLELSQERCLAAANYLDFNGITKDRIALKWYGESKPVAPNTNKDGSDNPEGRSLNRRTEFKIVE